MMAVFFLMALDTDACPLDGKLKGCVSQSTWTHHLPYVKFDYTWSTAANAKSYYRHNRCVSAVPSFGKSAFWLGKRREWACRSSAKNGQRKNKPGLQVRFVSRSENMPEGLRRLVELFSAIAPRGHAMATVRSQYFVCSFAERTESA